MWTQSRRHQRRAAVVAQVAVSSVLLLSLTAMTIDLGRLYVARSELQSAADAAALAGASVLLDEDRIVGPEQLAAVVARARQAVATYANLNEVLNAGLVVDQNTVNAPDGDVVVGYLADPTNRTAPLLFDNPALFNAVQVMVRRDAQRNGAIPLLFAQIFGLETADLAAGATATFQDGIVGFHVDGNEPNSKLLPFTLYHELYTQLLAAVAGPGNDNYRYDEVTGTVLPGSDGIPEINLFPGSGGGQLPPGNFGTLDIGGSDNSTADISRQILDGVSAADLAYFGGTLQLGDDGTLPLTGDTGISAAVKTELEAIEGQARVLPLFRSVSGPGDNANFVVDAFVGIRIMHVKLVGSMGGKQVIVQPAVVTDGTAVPGDDGGQSYYVYRPVMLSR